MENLNNQESVALDWNTTITPTADNFVTLPVGVYQFTVTKFERSQFNGSAKMKACPVADITLKCVGNEGVSFIRERLFLSSNFMWKLSSFFICIGQCQQGQPFAPDWNTIVGSTGYARLGIRTYTDKNGNAGSQNQVVNFLPPQNTQPVQQTVQQPMYQQVQQPINSTVQANMNKLGINPNDQIPF